MSNFLENQKKHFDKIVFNESSVSKDKPVDKIELDSLLNFMGDLNGKRILDLGSGSGRYSLCLAKEAKEVIGIDLSELAIKKVNKLAKEQGINNFKGMVSNFKDTSYENYFDYIVCINMLHHTDEIDIILQNIEKALKKDGQLIIFENNVMNPMFIPFFIMIKQLKAHLTMCYLKSNIFSLKKTLSRNNFNVIDIGRYGFLPTMLYNYSLSFLTINNYLNKLPVINFFTAFYFLKAIPASKNKKLGLIKKNIWI